MAYKSDLIKLLSFSLLLLGKGLLAQTGCPGCQTNLPMGLPVDTVYLPPIPNGQVGVYYDQDISFRMPKTTTPVSAIDSTTPPGVTISSIEIASVEGIPPGLSWEANQIVFPVATQTDGCIKICGTPTESDSFIIIVRLKAVVFIFTQEATFPMRMYIEPGISTNDGFTMSTPTGCGSTEVEFENNIPSGGQEGFSYEWNFGDSTSFVGENPPPHLYTEPGTYVVDYSAVVDTTGYILDQLILQELECVDLLGLGAPDVYLTIKDSTGTVIFNSGAAIGNISLPATINIHLPLQPGNYTMEVSDEDGGLKGGDDQCGIFQFNYLSNGPILSGGFVGILNISNPKTILHYTDTVTVFPIPAAPLLEANSGYFTCSNELPLPLEASISENIHWLLNGEEIPGATDSIYLVTASGNYQAVYTSEQGCTAVSDTAVMVITPAPAVPLFTNNNNLLTLYDTLALPDSYQLDWFLNGQDVDAHGYWLCTFESGTYTLVVTDKNTLCTNSYTLNTIFNPNADCTTGLNNLLAQEDVKIYPNPVSDVLQISTERLTHWQEMTLWDAAGRPVRTLVTGNTGALSYEFDCSGLPNGYYRLTLQHENGITTMPVIIQK